MTTPYYIGERLYLRQIEECDASLAVRWFNDPRNWATLARLGPMNLIREREWIARLYTDATHAAFVIALRAGDEPIGFCGLHDIHPANRSAWLGLLIGSPDHRGRGYGTEAIALLVRYGFEELNLNRIALGVMSTNAPAIRVYEKVGFRREGCFRQAYFRNGRWVDELRYAILREQWLPPAPPRADGARS